MTAWLSALGKQFLLKLLTLLSHAILDWIRDQIKEAKRKKDQEKSMENFEQVVHDPNTTPDHAGESYEDMFNSGR